MSTPFIAKCISGDVFLDEIDDYVDAWHDDSSSTMELYEYLGMTQSEYSLWMTTPSILGLIVNARRNGHSLEDLPMVEIQALAARAGSEGEAQHVMNWLKSIGKLDES